MNKNNWTVIAVVGILALLVLVLGPILLGGSRFGRWGMMGPGMMGAWGYSPFVWLGMAFMWLIPLAFLILVGLGIAWLVKAAGGGNRPVVSEQPCASCGRGIQNDWKNCPYCGAAITR